MGDTKENEISSGESPQTVRRNALKSLAGLTALVGTAIVASASSAEADVVCANTALSPAQLDVLRKLVTDGDLRVQFARNPMSAVASTGVPLSPEETARIAGIPANALNTLVTATHLTGPQAALGTTHTLLYAIIVALLLADQAHNQNIYRPYYARPLPLQEIPNPQPGGREPGIPQETPRPR